MIKAIMFDMGNVLLFFNAKVASRAFAETVGIPEEKVWEYFFISPLEKSYTKGKISTQEFFEQASEYFENKIDLPTFARLWNDIFTENIDMEPLVKKLKKNYPLYLISNTNELHYEFIRKKFGILKHFTKCFPSHEVGHRKPDPAMFEHVLKEIKLKPEETVFIDDMPEFVASAEKLGIHGVLFQTTSDLEKRLQKLGVIF